jgi:hypothetical protein
MMRGLERHEVVCLGQLGTSPRDLRRLRGGAGAARRLLAVLMEETLRIQVRRWSSTTRSPCAQQGCSHAIHCAGYDSVLTDSRQWARNRATKGIELRSLDAISFSHSASCSSLARRSAPGSRKRRALR